MPMDILFLIKSAHDCILHACETLANSHHADLNEFAPKFEKFRQIVEAHLAIEDEFLIPEISELLGHSGRIVEKQRNSQAEITQSLKTFAAILELDNSKENTADQLRHELAKFIGLVNGHIVWQQNEIMPKIRELIPTQEREDLGQVFIEVRDEIAQRVYI